MRTVKDKLKQDVFVKNNAPDNGQFQRRPRSQCKDKYFDTSRKILSQKMTMYTMEAFSILSLTRGPWATSLT